MKKTYITTVSPGYMFPLNVNFNSNKYFGTNADFHVIYSNPDLLPADYRDRCSKAFPFKVVWHPFEKSYHTDKYKYVEKIKDEYDSVCLIDADLFICCDTTEYFEKAAKEDLLITATYQWGPQDPDDMPYGNEGVITDRNQCVFADFPVFINPAKKLKLAQDWFNFCYDDNNSQRNHPMIAFNRAVCHNLIRSQVEVLDGNAWVCDANWWELQYDVNQNNRMYDSTGRAICAIHNRWWQWARAHAEWNGETGKYISPQRIANWDRAEHNMNAIKDYMEWFSNMTPETQWLGSFYKGKILRPRYEDGEFTVRKKTND